MQDNSLHTALVNSFNHLGWLVRKSRIKEGVSLLCSLSECEEVGLGFSHTKTGRKIGKTTAEAILNLFQSIPQIEKAGFTHFEEIQLLVDGVAKDRISDISCNYLLSFLIDFSMEQCEKWGITTSDTNIRAVYDYKRNAFAYNEKAKLPVNPTTKKPIVFVPKRWLRAIPWLNYEDYINKHFLSEVVDSNQRVSVLDFNRHNYDCVVQYTAKKELQQSDCKNDPLFTQLPLTTVARRITKLLRLPTGNAESVDKDYEQLLGELLPSLLYPHLDFADSQVRTESGSQIRDLVFYNNREHPFLLDIYNHYDCRQIVFELKNVQSIQREHINQLNRYLNDSFGKFGIIVTRNALTKAMRKNTIDLWSGQRRCILTITDDDIKLMGDVFRTKQRLPLEVLNKKFVEFLRDCPS